MASGQQPIGRGRGRLLTREVQSSSNHIPTAAVTPPPPNMSAVHISSNESAITAANTSHTSVTSSRGRGHRILSRREDNIPDPHWTVSDLTLDQFKTNDRPSKPTELGTSGEPINVITNCFPVIQFPQKGLIYQYDIQIWNKKNRLITHIYLRILYECWCRSFCEKYPNINRHRIVFDNDRTIFTYDQSLSDIDKNGITETMSGPNRENCQEEYKISIKLVGNPVDLQLLRSLAEFYELKTDTNINLNDVQTVKRMLAVLLHENCSSQADFIANRSYFSLTTSQNKHDSWDLGFGKTLRRGFSSSLIFTRSTPQLLMNLDVSHKVFMTKQPFLDFFCQVMVHSPCGKEQYKTKRQLHDVTVKQVSEFLDPNINGKYYRDEVEFLLKNCKNLRVRAEIANKTMKYNIHGLGEAASKQTFFWQTKKDHITVEKYYKEQYGIQLKYPSLPTLMMYKANLQMQQEPFVPMELVNIEPVLIKQMTDEQRASVSFQSIQKPSDCYRSIQQIRGNPRQQCFENDQYTTACNLRVDTNMLKIPARILTMPHILCDEQYRVTHGQCETLGVWNDTKTQFYTPANFPDVWALINLSSLDQQACETFYHNLYQVAKTRGMQCPLPRIYEEYNVQPDTIEDIIYALKQLMVKNEDCKFFIAILPEQNPIRDEIYAEIKELCELESGELGIATQMLKLKDEEIEGHWNYSRLDYLCQKINTKLNGINSSIDVPDGIRQFFSRVHRTMYVGIDLSHPAPGLGQKRSTVAVVASADDIPTKYFKEIYIQERLSDEKSESWEYIVDLKEIMKSLISQYDQHRDGPPKSIIIYRDGISTSEFNTVFEKELAAIREACIELSSFYRPYLTYIIVNRKHHIRFFAEDLEHNVPAGTVTDSHDITNPTTYDFFLISHHAAKGTSRAVHYHVLYDDNKLKPDEVHMLTYALCFIYGRCRRSIAVPAPVKYADLLAFRAGIYERINGRSHESLLPQKSAIPINEEVNVDNKIKSRRIVLSSKLIANCPFFV